jgi:hypothetical protein
VGDPVGVVRLDAEATDIASRPPSGLPVARQRQFLLGITPPMTNDRSIAVWLDDSSRCDTMLRLPATYQSKSQKLTLPRSANAALARIDLEFELARDEIAYALHYRPPEVSSRTFAAHLPNLQSRTLMDMDFVVIRQLVPPELPHIRFLSVRSRFCYTLP